MKKVKMGVDNVEKCENREEIEPSVSETKEKENNRQKSPFTNSNKVICENA